ncbi:MAG: tRNA uridine-5-carboxymethylaminomethyl(34) synthesis GTPase MnmE [Bacteroidales bacterium]|nr:tRNA uridine-5-carboxymethylaminomethyl(34) synthesis GTPase MnmE [Bacteroidales bacterium]
MNLSNLKNLNNGDTICALSTPPGIGAIAVIRVSGSKTFKICDKIFYPKNLKAKLKSSESHKIYFGVLKDEDKILDEVLISVFKQPHSYTGEDSVEISCHGSEYIQQKIIELLLKQKIRLAEPGEFTLRAFLNGKFDLSQAEAVADLIASHSKTSHELALKQMRGGFSDKINNLRKQLINFSSLIELELDFSEEDVEFADREKLSELLQELKSEVTSLIDSFSIGNVLKKGIPVAIIGKANVGKSTLLNAILNEEKAIVSEIPGTTRDFIEDTISIKGVLFRFIDTAGLRDSQDKIETIGIERTYQKINQAKIILYIFDVSKCTSENLHAIVEEFSEYIKDKSKRFILIGNKIDKLVKLPKGLKDLFELETIFISAKRKENINAISESLIRSVNTEMMNNTTIISNTRHLEMLSRVNESIANIENGLLNDIPTDLLTIDIRDALHYLGEITGEITTNEVLANIFGKFCIGK